MIRSENRAVTLGRLRLLPRVSKFESGYVSGNGNDGRASKDRRPVNTVCIRNAEKRGQTTGFNVSHDGLRGRLHCSQKPPPPIIKPTLNLAGNTTWIQRGHLVRTQMEFRPVQKILIPARSIQAGGG